jgi:NIMA (never in mitosis gene a)-related kinase
MSSLKQFKIIKLLGKGSYSKVYKVRRIQNGDIYALKKVKLGKLTRKEKENSLNEVRILASIKHPYIISYKEAFYDKRESCLCIVMEYAGSGDMLNKIRQFKKKKYFPEKLI